MRYRLHFRDADGHPFTLSGVKTIRDDPGFDMWADTTTLACRLFKGHLSKAEESIASAIAAGVLRIYVADFLRQLASFVMQGGTWLQPASALAAFGKFFLRNIWAIYGWNSSPHQVHVYLLAGNGSIWSARLPCTRSKVYATRPFRSIHSAPQTSSVSV